MQISNILDSNIDYLNKAFADCGDIVNKKFTVGNRGTMAYIVYIDMMADRSTIELSVISKLKRMDGWNTDGSDIFSLMRDDGITTVDFKEIIGIDEANDAILSGDTVLFMDGYAKALVISTKGFPNRGVQSTDTEVVVQGSKESFNEVIRFNTVLIRRRIRDTRLKVKQMSVGRRSNTDIALMYLEDVVRPEILKNAEGKIKNIDIDAILDSGYIEQLIEDSSFSPFPQVQVTERPDKAAAAILEGRIVIVVDNSPFVLIIPATINTFFQASEDYYQRWGIMSFVRIIRYIAGFTTIALPGLYIAITTYHPSMIPMLLLFKMAGARQSIPFPAVVEVLLMDLTFELLREAGIRLPGPVGSTIGIVGGLILGQAAVEAGLVSPIIVIIIAATGIASFAVPHVSLVTGFRLVKYFIIALSAALGLYGFCLAALAVLIHLASLRSFGIPYLSPYVSGDINDNSDIKDSLFRAPLTAMRKRPVFANQKNIHRQRED